MEAFLIALQTFVAVIAILGGVVVLGMSISIVLNNTTTESIIIGMFSILISGCLIGIGILVSTF